MNDDIKAKVKLEWLRGLPCAFHWVLRCPGIPEDGLPMARMHDGSEVTIRENLKAINDRRKNRGMPEIVLV